MRKILLSISTLAIVGVVAVGATTAFFSDTEMSSGNTFTAGSIDLTIGNSSYVTDENGDVVHSSSTSWQRADLDGQLFFDFDDIKPGDIGEDTISIHVDDNDSWACMATRITATPENGQTEPEAEVDDSAGENEGELQDQLQFAVWADDGDNVYEDDERLLQLGGEGNPIITAAELASQGVLTLADSEYSFLVDSGEPLAGGEEYHLAKAWCLGELEEAPLEQGEANDPTEGTGFICNGAGIGNETQTDGIEGDIEFYAVQSRNNEGFVCGQDYTPSWGEEGEDELPFVESSISDGWSPVDTGDGFDWFAKAKVQEPNPASDFEVQVGVGDSNPADFDQGDTVYSDDVATPFTLTYDGSGTATFTANGESTTYSVGSDPISTVGVNVRAPSDATTTVSNLSLSTGTLGNTSVSITNGTRNLTAFGASLNGGFTLTGDLTFDWETLTGNGEDQKVQISIN